MLRRRVERNQKYFTSAGGRGRPKSLGAGASGRLGSLGDPVTESLLAEPGAMVSPPGPPDEETCVEASNKLIRRRKLPRTPRENRALETSFLLVKAKCPGVLEKVWEEEKDAAGEAIVEAGARGRPDASRLFTDPLTRKKFHTSKDEEKKLRAAQAAEAAEIEATRAMVGKPGEGRRGETPATFITTPEGIFYRTSAEGRTTRLRQTTASAMTRAKPLMTIRRTGSAKRKTWSSDDDDKRGFYRVMFRIQGRKTPVIWWRNNESQEEAERTGEEAARASYPGVHRFSVRKATAREVQALREGRSPSLGSAPRDPPGAESFTYPTGTPLGGE